MKKQLLSLTSIGTFSLALMLPTPYLRKINLDTNLIKNYNTNINNDDKWIDSIKESSNQKFPKLIFSRYATLVYQQVMLVTEYMLLANTNRTNNDDILFFYNNSEYNSNNWGVKDWEEKYSKNETSNNDWSFKVVNNLSKIDSSLDDYNYEQFPSETITNSLLSYYTKKDPNIKFDIWIIDFGLEEWFWNNSDTYEFMKHVNKIYVMSDGNYQPYFFLKDALDRYTEYGYKQLTQDEIEEKFKKYREDTSNSLKSEFQNHKLYDFINDENIFTFFHTNPYTESEYYNQTYDLKNKNIKLYKTYKMNYNYYDLASKLFSGNTKSTEENIKAFSDDYEKFFKIYGFNNLSNFIWKNSDKYDPKKKNVIWLGDSLFKEKKQMYPEKLKEIRSIMQSWFKMFPLNEYNFFSKNHPSYSEDSETKWPTDIPDWIYGQVQLSNIIINDEEQASNVIYFQKVPWEIFLSWDYKQQMTNKDYVPIFNSNPNKNNTVFVGFQYTTTVIQTTAFFLEDVYGYSSSDVNKTLSSYYFPVPETFDVVVRTDETTFLKEDCINGVYAKTNIRKIEDIYDPFVLLKTFPEYKNDQILASDFIRKNYDSNYSIYENQSNNKNNNILAISISVSVISIVLLIVIVAFVIFYKKKNKKN